MVVVGVWFTHLCKSIVGVPFN